MYRVCAGHGKPGKSWCIVISFTRPGKSWILTVGHGKSLKIMFMKKNHKDKKRKRYTITKKEKEPRNIFSLSRNKHCAF